MTTRQRARLARIEPACGIAYMRVSTSEQVESGAGLDAQRAAVESYAQRTGLRIGHWHTEAAVSGSVAPLDRPELRKALAQLAACGPGGVLVVSRLDRLARKASDVLALRDVARREGWALVATDGSIETVTPHGRAMTTVLSAFAELERDLIATRTREALAARKADGVRLGRPVQVPDSVRARVVAARRRGRSLGAIADGLTRDGVPTVQGGQRWYASTVASVLRSVARDRDAAVRARRSTEGAL